MVKSRPDKTMLSFDNVQDFITRYDDYSTKRREHRRVTKQKGASV